MFAGLFRRAILLSGSALSSWALVEDPVSYALDLAKQVNCTAGAAAADALDPEPIVDCLRDVPLDRLMSAAVALPTYLSAFGPSVDGVVVKSNYHEDVVTNLLPEFDGYSGSAVAFGARKFQKFEFGGGVNKYDLLFGVVTSEALWRFSSNDIQVSATPVRPSGGGVAWRSSGGGGGVLASDSKCLHPRQCPGRRYRQFRVKSLTRNAIAPVIRSVWFGERSRITGLYGETYSE